MKYIVAGGRDFDNKKIMDQILSAHINPQFDIIISGDARGADMLGAEWGAQHGVPIQHFPAYWDQYGQVWTIGYGHTGSDVYQGLTITKAKAQSLNF